MAPAVTVDENTAVSKQRGKSKSPWINSKLLFGLGIILLIFLIQFIGPMILGHGYGQGRFGADQCGSLLG